MAISVLMTIISISILQASAKTNPVVVTHEGKMRYSTQRLNTVSSTAKPEVQHQIVHQFQNLQLDKGQNYLGQNSPALPQQQQQQQLVLQPVQYQRPLIHQISTPVQNQLHPQSQQQILQLIQKVLYNTQQSNQPTAMIIIAQPTYANPNTAQPTYANPNTAQQLLNYFHSNPQARYQFVHGSAQVQAVPQYAYQPQYVQLSQPSSSYPLVPAPAQYHQTKVVPVVTPTTHMSPVQPSESYSQPLPQISQLAQLATQQYYQQYPEAETRQNDVDYPSSLPPIITGLENFSADQQEKIKAQLSAHFGAPLQPLKDQKNYHSLNTNEFVPSQEVKSPRSNIMSINK